MKPLALITGVGPGTGASVARRFAAAGYRTALLARNEKRLNALASELPDSKRFCLRRELTQKHWPVP
jgi:NADP-dependent 3-hydroxy acid dehydrogenase YdfG